MNGFVGQHLFHFLQEKKYEVYGIYKSGSAISENCYKADLSNREETYRLINVTLKDKVDVLIHTASVIANADNLDDLAVVFQNTAIAKNIADSIQSSGIKQLINFSSSSVYPNVDGLFTEKAVPNPAKMPTAFMAYLNGMQKWF
ncbi:NAD-dependent epimerase/dehydratase family protein [Niabella sp. W65]|nr:NAD-dependent epimerase/dehydratase family protein [Niabella sp. W65]MCH7365028.1 NAD-dependent epimerase/dehydratase family protein [Niabella sp. W65]ULT40844.1 NAD-dependent epimerase/dehydratase family protein [Niabella sp. I65]